MLGFDHELRRQGFAGNTCQIVLQLSGTISVEKLRRRLEHLTHQHPILNARPGGWLWPEWKLPARPVVPQVRVHPAGTTTSQQLLNEPLDLRLGELMRFDLCEGSDGRQVVSYDLPAEASSSIVREEPPNRSASREAFRHEGLLGPVACVEKIASRRMRR